MPQVNSPPQVVSAPEATPASAFVGQEVAVTSTWFDPDGDGLFYSWEWGNGSSTGYLTAPDATYTYNDPGIYMVVLTVTDGKAIVAQSLTIRIVAYELAVQKAKVNLNLDPSKTTTDKILCKALIVYPDGYTPVELEQNGLTAIIGFGGVAFNATDLIYKGKAGKKITLRDAGRQFKLSWRFRKKLRPGKPNAAVVIFKLRGTGFAEIMRDNGYLLDENNPRVDLPVSLRLGGNLFTAELQLIFGETRLKASTSSYGFTWKAPR